MPESQLEANNFSTVKATEEVDNLVQVENLRKHFPIQSGFIANLLNQGNIPAVKAPALY